MEPKFIIFWLVALVGIPIGTALCLHYPRFRQFLFIAMIWCTAEPDLVSINFLSREFYRAMTRGIEISLADICALSLAFYFILDKAKKVRRIPPLLFLFVLYLAVACTSWILAAPNLSVPDAATYIPYPEFETKLYPLFELSKMFRGIIIFWVVYQFCLEEKNIPVVVLALGFTTAFLTYIVIFDRYVLGINRVKATLGHPNTLATYMAMMGTFLFAFSVAARQWFRSFLILMPVGFAGVCVIMTISRGGLMALALGMALVFSMLIIRNVSVKNGVLIFLGVLFATGMLGYAANTLMHRFFGEQDAEADLEYRGKYNSEAKLMATEHLFGIGPGNFSAWSWNGYAETVDPDLPPGTPPHNLWFLTLGEMGWPGLICFALLWLRFYQIVLPFCLLGKSGYFHTAVVAGTCATLAGHLQNALQLGFRQSPLFFLNHVFLAVALASVASDPKLKRWLLA
jgi:O-antigen ligase